MNGIANESNCRCTTDDVAFFFGSDKRATEAGGSRMDSDGLVAHVDPAQERVREIVERYRGEVQRLKREVHVAKQQQAMAAAAAANSSPNGNCNGLLTAAALYPGRNGGGADDEAAGFHVGAGSTTSEASSFEQVETAEARPTLWLPDHATSSCMK